MLKKDAIDKLAKFAKIDPAILTAAITDAAEMDLTIDDTLVTFSPAELTSRDTEQQNTGRRSGEQTGELKGKELAAKVFKTTLGITDDTKDPEAVAKLAQARITADDASKQQITALQTQLSQKETELTTTTRAKEAAEFKATLVTFLPSDRSKALETDDHINLITNNLTFTPEGVKGKDGKFLLDSTTTTPLQPKEAVEQFYKARPALLEAPAAGASGRGGGDQGGGGGKVASLKQAREDWEKSNPGRSSLSQDFQEHVKALIVANPEMDMTEG